MKSFEGLNIKDYSYNLPQNKIAQFPLENRDNSKLLYSENGEIKQTIFKNISSLLPSDSLILFNETKVIHARLFFKKETGAKIEIFCLEPVDEYQIAFQTKKCCKWKCLIGNASKWKTGILINKLIHENSEITLSANLILSEKDSFIVEFSWTPDHLAFSDIIEIFGEIPLPPYIERNVENDDLDRYQTIYAKTNGSVATPTAGLHFTENVLDSFKNKKIEIANVTLHVGAGTFKPIKENEIAKHLMHTESFYVEFSTLENLINKKYTNIISVGTTTIRTLESVYWLGVKLKLKNKEIENNLVVNQWDPYSDELNCNISLEESINTILNYLKSKGIKVLSGQTSLMIVPGYKFRTSDYLITNFHMPNSTLLLLIAAFYGNDWKNLYNFALQNDFRFLSYGDSCLLQRI